VAKLLVLEWSFEPLESQAPGAFSMGVFSPGTPPLMLVNMADHPAVKELTDFCALGFGGLWPPSSSDASASFTRLGL